MRRRFRFLLIFVLLLCAGAAATPSFGQAEGSRYVLLLGGLGGDPTYSERFATYLSETRALLETRHGVPAEFIHVLAEESLSGRPFVQGVSTAENIRASFARLAGQVSASDHVYIILFGHGSFDGEHAMLNIPRQDLNDAEYADLVGGLGAGRVVFINTASASGPFASALSGENRIVMTATATGTERDETLFPRFLVEALRAPEADQDKNGSVSVGEMFAYASEQAARSFEASGHLATEHALIEDNGDGEPTRFDALDGSGDGHLSSVTYLHRPDVTAFNAADRELLGEKETLERDIAALKGRKGEMDEDQYYEELESLFIRLAHLNERLESSR